MTTGNCQFVNTTEEAGVYYCLFLYLMVPTQIPATSVTPLSNILENI